jgi:hypothetical protein
MHSILRSVGIRTVRAFVFNIDYMDHLPIWCLKPGLSASAAVPLPEGAGVALGLGSHVNRFNTSWQ